MSVRKLKLPSGKVIDVDTEYVPPMKRRRPMPHYDRLAERCDDKDWTLELAYVAARLYLAVVAYRPDGVDWMAGCRVDSSLDSAARAILRAL